jgi:pyruvate ferredoxin oxidoreductase delta subunit
MKKQENGDYLLGPVATDFASVDTGKWRNKRPVINDNCRKCKQCMLYCPCGVIRFSEQENKLEIDYRYCKGCGICENICKFSAIDLIGEEEYERSKK